MHSYKTVSIDSGYVTNSFLGQIVNSTHNIQREYPGVKITLTYDNNNSPINPMSLGNLLEIPTGKTGLVFHLEGDIPDDQLAKCAQSLETALQKKTQPKKQSHPISRVCEYFSFLILILQAMLLSLFDNKM